MTGFPKPITIKLTPYEKMLARATMAKNKRVLTQEASQRKKAIGLKGSCKKKSKRVKLPSIRSLVLKADQKFAAFIRNRDGNKCVLCSSLRSPTCGHLIKRGKKATRWDEVNCNCLCSGCNYKDNFEHDHYVLWFLREYGQPMYEDLLERSKRIVKLNREYLTKIIEEYENKNRG